MSTSLINTKLQPFNATAYHNGDFVELTEKDVLGKWSIFFFYPADFTFVCPTELGDLAGKTWTSASPPPGSTSSRGRCGRRARSSFPRPTTAAT